jgi:PAS domain S-box-containing protein
VVSVDGYFQQVNPAFERTLGYTDEELLRRPFFDLVHPDDLERTREAMEVLRRGQELHQFENRYVCRDGSIRWLQWNTRPGPSEGLVATAARDVTDSRARKEQEALRHLATLVARRASSMEVFTAVASEVASLLDADFSVIGRYEPDGSLTHVAANPLALVTALGPRMALDGEDLASVVRQSGQPALDRV